MTTDEVLQTPFCQVPMGEFLRLYKSQGPMNVPVEMVPFGKYMELERTISITAGWGNALIMSVVSVVLVQWWQRRTQKKKAAEMPAAAVGVAAYPGYYDQGAYAPTPSMCGNSNPEGFWCNANLGHEGAHVARRSDGEVMASW